MGISFTSIPIEYGIFIGDSKPNETKILRNPLIGAKPLIEINKYNVETLCDALENTVKRMNKASCNCLGTRSLISKDVYGDYQWKTYQQIYDDSISFAKGLYFLELITVNDTINQLKFLGIYSRNREEWIIGDISSSLNSITVIPIPKTKNLADIPFILNQTNMSTMLIDNKYLPKIATLCQNNQLYKLKNLIVLKDQGIDKTVIDYLIKQGMKIYEYEQILLEGRSKNKGNCVLNHSNADSIFTICYTSNNDDVPKGAIITHKALMAHCDMISPKGFDLIDEDIYFSFTPLSNMMERLSVVLFLTHGKQIGFSSGNSKKIFDDAKILMPTFICGIPYFFNQLHKLLLDMIDIFEPMQKYIIKRAIELKLNDYATKGIIVNTPLDYIILKNFPEVLGGQVRFMICSGHIDPTISIELKVYLSCFICEGYTHSEIGGLLFSHPNDKIIGHVGGPGPSDEVKLVDLNKHGYTTKDINPLSKQLEPRGEICIRSVCFFNGYYLNNKATHQAIDNEGWFHTGDVGMILIQHGNAIKVIDCIHDNYVSSKGNIYSVSKIEKILLQCPYIKHIYIHLKYSSNKLVGIISPNIDNCIAFLNNNPIKKNSVSINTNEDLKHEILLNCHNISKQNGLCLTEMIYKIYITSHPFTIENGLLMSDAKINRIYAKQFFQKDMNLLLS